MASRKSGHLAAVPDKQHPPPPDLRDGLEEALAELRKLAFVTNADLAMVALAQRYATEIEQVIDNAAEADVLWREAVRLGGDERMLFVKRLERLEAKCEVTKMIGWLGPQLQGVLRDLGGASVARKAMEKKNPIGGRLGAIRDGLPGARPGARSAGLSDAEGVDKATD